MKRAIGFLPLLAGCYSYTAITPSAAPVGIEVRAKITGAASDRVAPLIGTFDTRELVGNVVENTAGSLVLQVSVGAKPNVTADVIQSSTQVPLAPADIVSLEQRKLDKTSTTLLTAAVLTGVTAAVAAALKAGGHAEQGAGQPEPPAINRIPIWTLRF